MTREEKVEWLSQANDEKILRQYWTLENNNLWGKLDEDIELTKAEIIKRMAACKERS